MDELSEMSVEKFRIWSLCALKVYLARRNKPIDGNLDELSARAFCAWEENLPVDSNAELAEQRLQQEYKAKLNIKGDIIPDPFSLSLGWKGEKKGLSSWPSVYITDIAHYLGEMTSSEIVNRLLNEYKEGKAYRYFECGWVKEVHIHDISEKSDKCFLKAKVTPSQALNKKAYDIWVLVEKDISGRVGGKVMDSYCSCTAGMLGLCNHVAGVLFRIEDAVKRGITKKSKTSLPSTWNVPRSKPIMKPLKVEDVAWIKSSYGKDRDSVLEKQKQKNNFTPLNKEQTKRVNDEVTMRNALYNMLKDDVGDSCFVQFQEKKRHIKYKPIIPSSVIDVISIEIDKPDYTIESVLKALTVSKEDAISICNETVEQASSELWHHQRKGRITASIFHRVASRVRTLEKDPDVDVTALTDSILGKKSIKPTIAMKHGTALEPVAKRAYNCSMKKEHKRFTLSQSGLNVSLKHPYLAASPDLVVKCECCGEGLCEIKCPETLKDEIPSVDNVTYIHKKDENTFLDPKHQYYYQIQGQMGILGKKYCDLYIYSFHGSLTVRVHFDQDFWDKLEMNLSMFWTNYVFHAICGHKSQNEKDSANQPTEIDPNDNENNKKIPVATCSVPTMSVISTPSTAKRILIPACLPPIKRKNTGCKTKEIKLVFLCGVCGLDCLDYLQSKDDQSVQCDICGVWTHYVCAGETDISLSATTSWFCKKCLQ